MASHPAHAQVFIAKGSTHDEKILFRGEADEAPDTVPGDVVVVLQQNQHEVFHRDGANLIIEKKILLAEALCGFTFHIKHLDRRTLVVKSDPNVVYKPGDVKAVMNEGMPIRSNPMLRGNLYIKFSIGTTMTGWLLGVVLVVFCVVCPLLCVDV